MAVDSGTGGFNQIEATGTDIIKSVRPGGLAHDIGAYENMSPSKETTVPEGIQKVYMAPDGDDAGNCNVETPCRTFEKATSLLEPGYELVLLDGYYALDHNGSLATYSNSGQPIPLSGMLPSGIDQQHPTIVRAKNLGGGWIWKVV